MPRATSSELPTSRRPQGGDVVDASQTWWSLAGRLLTGRGVVFAVPSTAVVSGTFRHGPPPVHRGRSFAR
jgi:hypothetical protein